MFERNYNEPIVQDAAVYPNPAHDFIFFRPDKVDALANQDGELSISIVDILGNPVEANQEKISENTYRIDVSQCSAGYYILIAQLESGQELKKKLFRFLKQ